MSPDNVEYRIWLKDSPAPIRLSYEGIRQWLETPELVDRVECREINPWRPTTQSLVGDHRRSSSYVDGLAEGVSSYAERAEQREEIREALEQPEQSVSAQAGTHRPLADLSDALILLEEVEFAMRHVPIKPHDRTSEEQKAVEAFTTYCCWVRDVLRQAGWRISEGEDYR